MAIERVDYQAFDIKATGYAAYPAKATEKSPAIILAHAWRGLDDFVKEKAEMIASHGYVAFAADLYGGVEAKDDDEAFKLMSPLFVNRALLRKRFAAAFDLVKGMNRVDSNRVGAIGFCFGGAAVIELMRSGLDLKGIVSFHGVLGNQIGGLVASEEEVKTSKQCHALILHGDQDPLVTQQDIDGLKREFTQSAIDWQFHIFGNTVHAFTNPAVDNFKEGLCFDAKANKRSWKMMFDFFEEILK
ncbi:dienelactone hydrolase family protein [Estrella lausannensis]|uniref:Dienelactone hydrolase family protein n=1 Tax=Estrella lausannensis TaxID=483423 RepID=A0A0H5DP18_9BACT|nr:dienelactone hydrolase family protein [Estrella lausannensis]CRX38077.1 Dienelactone hydrolase family protein [Estrella lausannensis]